MAKVEVYEVGWAYANEHPTPEHKREALLELLTDCGTDADLWILYPEIREHHVQVGLGSFGRGPLSVGSPCGWAVYGQMKTDPKIHRIIEGQTIPVRTHG
jgi:hypothetical protein